jgi:hypothetical protein
MRELLIASLVALGLGAAPRLSAHTYSAQECLEGGDFITHAAQARDNGMTKSDFLDRLTGDIRLIQAYPPELRWFVADPEDADFLRDESARVFDAPVEPEAHRRQFLMHCFDRALRAERG